MVGDTEEMVGEGADAVGLAAGSVGPVDGGVHWVKRNGMAKASANAGRNRFIFGDGVGGLRADWPPGNIS
jgi:hypothetical protein